ncbi:MMPL family transporter [Micromonospora halophytica]|uniref:Putative drug exporter of the RND superfamily n=1 Tax=Micromonospora halophytica TaxID=47864 RepID=A0A1C5J8H1_9ACTN|nr:MMPL family transporter [Micromonospora halophytica]SCG66561.1 putative drug exporter of the RND superfamily [Micromonospora halophytica]
MLAALGRFSVRHRWLVVVTWVLLLIGALGAGREFGGSFTNDLTLADTDSQAAYDTLRDRFPDMSGDGMQVVIHRDSGVTSPEVQHAVDASLAEVRADRDIAAAQSPYGPGQRLVSDDGRTAIATVQFNERAKDIPRETLEQAQASFEPLRDLGLQVEYGGPAVQTESGPSGSEVYGLVAAVIVLLIAFGSLFAMVVPIVTALMALGVGMGVIELLANSVTIGTSGPVVAAMIGLGVGIDYALLVVTRHREGLSLGHDPHESIERAMRTAGRAVLVAGATVIVAILSLYLIGIPFVSALALASAITVAATLLAAVTLLPALLGIFGGKLDRLRIRRIQFDHGGGRESGWHRWARGVQRWRWIAVPLAAALLVILALPLTSLRLGTGDGGSQPTESTQRKAYDLVTEDFGPGRTGPLLVTVSYPTGTSAQQAGGELRAELLAIEGVTQVSPPRVDTQGSTALLTVVPSGSPDDESTERLVHRLRSDVLPEAAAGAETHVGGATATSIDLADKLDERMIWFMLLVVGLAFLVLLAEFRSLLVPLVAVVMNLLAVGAAYGPVVAVFQWGWWPAELIGAQPGPVESFAPVMLFAVLFGLSTDYAVFLLSRVHEEFKQTGDARRSIVNGMGATSRVIMAAASVMVVVFASFVLNDQRTVNLFGFGLATAIAMYALVAMLVLTPALLAVLGRAAWWFPGESRHRPTPANLEP